MAQSNRLSIRILTLLAALIAIGSSLPGWAQYDPPVNYYNNATGTGSTLKSQLHNIIDGHTVLSYNAARSNLQVTDRDPTDSDRIILIYDRDSLDVSNLNGSVPGWDNGVSWNREHTWPRALGVDSSGPDNSDLHMLRPSDPAVNSDRGNLHFGGAYGQSFGENNDGGATVWYPGDADAGMVARQMFYAAVRYDGSDAATNDLELANGTPSSPRLGNLSRMIEWHYEVAPDDFELRRNDVIYDSYQGNRNPFADRPEFVWSTFVDQSNDSRIAIAGANVDTDGSSSLDIDLGRVFVGSNVNTSQNVMLNKQGNDGTYYQVTSNGDATSTLAGRFNNFRSGGTDSQSFVVGLNANTSSTGLATGTVAIDNLDITTGGGIGRGANDASDTINLSLEVVNHAIPSFDTASVNDTLTLDFGSVELGSDAPSLSFQFFNVALDPDFTADLEIDAFAGMGDTAQLTTDLVTLVGSNAIPGGGNATFDATLATACVGQFSATYLVQVSDEDLVGANSSFMVLNLAGQVIGQPLAGDYDMDGDVDAEDYTVWTMDFGSTTNLAADGSGNGIVDAEDFTIWRDNLGASHPTCSSSVPESSGWLLVALSLLFCRPRPISQRLISENVRFLAQDRSSIGEY